VIDQIDVESSMKKSVAVLVAAAIGCVAVALCVMAWLPGAAGSATTGVVSLAAIACVLTAAGGSVAMHRQHRIATARPDLFAELNEPRSERALLAASRPPIGAVRRWLAHSALGHGWVAGDTVRIRSLEEIRATLDDKGQLAGLSFMEEMKPFCGRTARVYRALDKIYDYGRSRTMRQLDQCVLLAGLRCDGQGHGACDAACYLIWKEAWLEKVGDSSAPFQPTPVAPSEAAPSGMPGRQYSCQYTELTNASHPHAPHFLRRWVEPWIVGNVTLPAYCVVALTRAFNAFQEWRGGIPYPARPRSGGQTSTIGMPLKRGDWVRVRSPAEIAGTLDANGKNRGLWFDRDMLKYCGRSFRVLGRVRQIVDIRSTAMIPMKSPCIILEDVHYSGEFQWFGEQHDYLYWREAWLQPVATPGEA